MKNNEEPLRIAHIIGKWVGGGVEAVVMNYYRAINRNKIQFDFICDEDSTNIPYKEIEKLGGKVILIPPYQKVIKYQRELQKILREGNYKIVHSHINALSVFPLRAAKKAGVPIRIAHSHSTTNKKEWKKNLVKVILKPFSKIYATNYFACTEHAARWLFGDKEYENGNVYLLNNAIDVKKFKYNKDIRKEKRIELGIGENTLVIGHIGRFVEQKNHKFLINIFNDVHKNNKDSKMILVGQGPLEQDIKRQINELGIDDSVIILGQRNDVNELYQVFDVFLFPSLYEGLGMVLIEAQTSGVPCITSTEVPSIVNITDNVYFIDLNNDNKIWVKQVLNSIDDIPRKSYEIQIENAGYNINVESRKLESIYYKCIGEKNEKRKMQ